VSTEPAAAQTSIPYRSSLLKLVQTLDITNIRLLMRILRLVSEIVGSRTDLSSAVQTRILPTLVLFPAVFYRGVPDAPSLRDLLNYGSLRLMVCNRPVVTVLTGS
jgi:hypothetical protein